MSTLRERTIDRLRKSIAGEKVDAHAVFNFYTYPFYHEVTKVPLKDYFHDSKLMFDTQMEVLKQLEYCGNLMPDLGAVPESTSLGGKVRFDDHGFISVHEAEEPDLEDLVNLKPGDPYADNYMTIALKHLEYMVANAPKELSVNAHPLMGAFTIAAQVRGISDFCMDAITEREMVEEFLEIVLQTQINFMKAQEKILGRPFGHMLICDDLAAFLSPQVFEELILPGYKKLFDAFPNTQPWLHNDSTAGHVVELIAKSGFKAWQYGVMLDPAEVAKRTEGKLSLLGGLKPVEMAQYSVEQIEEECQKLLEGFAGNPRCVMSTGGSINQVPVRNILAMLKYVDQYKI